MAGVISADSDAASQYNNLGRVYLESGRVDDAIESFERAEKLDRAGGNFFGLAKRIHADPLRRAPVLIRV